MSIRYYTSTAVPQSILNTGGINATATAIQVSSTATYPSSFPFTLALDRGTSSQEVVLCTSTTGGDVFNVTRGYDGTTAVSHNQGASVEHTASAIDYREANTFVNLLQNVGDLLVGTGSGNHEAYSIPSVTVGGYAVNTNGFVLTQDSTQAGGVSWQPAVPAGVVAHTASGSAPSGWLVANGASVSASTYPELFAAIGYTYGGSAGSFNLPPIQGKMILGTLSGTFAFASTGGTTTLTIGYSNMPSHTHPISVTDSGHTHNIGSNVFINLSSSTIGPVATGGSSITAGTYTGQNTTVGYANLSASSSAPTGTLGQPLTSGQFFPPYVVLTPIIKF